MESKKLTRIGLDVDQETLEQMKELGLKEKWSLRRIALVALENYLKLRGVREEQFEKKE